MLNAKQRKFVKWYITTGIGSEAAIRSGYSSTTARATASRLLKNEEVMEAIEEELNNKYGFIPDAKEVIELWSDIMRNPEEKTSNRLAASSYLAKIKGMFNPDNQDLNWYR